LIRLAPDQGSVQELPEWLNENPEVKMELSSIAGLKRNPENDSAVIRYEISRRFVNYAIACTERGDFMAASASAYFAKAFSTDNMAALAISAEVYFRWEDRVAVYYARMALAFKEPKVQGRLAEILAGPETAKYQRSLRDRMNFIIRECTKHPEWRDSYQLKNDAGLLD
jgi:hypothetical protein